MPVPFRVNGICVGAEAVRGTASRRNWTGEWLTTVRRNGRRPNARWASPRSAVRRLPPRQANGAAKAPEPPPLPPRRAFRQARGRSEFAEDEGHGAPPSAGRLAPPARRVAANDDVPSIGGLIFALQQKPSNQPFMMAAAASGGWLAIGALLAWAIPVAGDRHGAERRRRLHQPDDDRGAGHHRPADRPVLVPGHAGRGAPRS